LGEVTHIENGTGNEGSGAEVIIHAAGVFFGGVAGPVTAMIEKNVG